MTRVGVIADDLTGANGTGVKLSKQGFTSVTGFNQMPTDIPGSNIVVSLDTDSRYIKPESAKDKVRHTVRQLQQWRADIICKRIDSTFRGNIGAELDALLESIDDESVGIVVPSYPSSGRTVIGGYMLVNGTLLHETDVANDPVHPMHDSYLPKILSEQTDQCIGLLELKDIKMGASVTEKKLQKMIDEGNRLIICDAVTNKHIDAIAEAMLNVKEKKCIPIDSGPLTSFFVGKKNQTALEIKSKILVSVGSVTNVTESQLKYLINEMKVTPIHVDPNKLISFGPEREEGIRRVVKKVEEEMEKQPIIVITTNHPDHPIVNFKQISISEGVSEDRLAKRITSGLAEISKRLIQKDNAIKGCFFSGGDVTASFCETIQAQGIKLIDEVMPLAAYGEIIGGDFDGLSIVTKGGLVGGKTAIYDSVEYLNQVIKTTRRISHEK